MYYSSSLKSNMAYVNDSDEEQEEEEDMLLACILVMKIMKIMKMSSVILHQILLKHQFQEILCCAIS